MFKLGEFAAAVMVTAQQKPTVAQKCLYNESRGLFV